MKLGDRGQTESTMSFARGPATVSGVAAPKGIYMVCWDACVYHKLGV